MGTRLAFTGITFMLLSLVTTDCSRQQQQSPIVGALEQSGSGLVSGSSVETIQSWLGPRSQLSHEIENMCREVRPKADAQWPQTTEGRICTASRNVASLRAVPAHGDGQKFQPGVH
jgi:hypothetical protein